MTTQTETRAPPFTNRLAKEKSPYLLQHAHNPVDWHPWGEAAFARARKENKPIFLSIGYSTCHWCHVMERESFEDEAVARRLNRDFVSIKVDREERPDVDAVYMTYLQAATGSGGWPMSIWLTPNLKPFFGGTYFPPEDTGGRPGFKTLLERIAEAWRVEPNRLEASGDSALNQLQAAAGRNKRAERLEPARLLALAFDRLAESYDPINGGFGGAPKFPRPAVLHFLFRHHARTGRKEALAMALHTLRRMVDGGIHDRLGGGFHRYAVDERWHVPHFEKMLYDQAQMAAVAIDAHQVTRDPAWAALARDVLDYVKRDLTGPEGQFYSAEDADSPLPDRPEERAEGRFYVWEADEIRAALGDRRGAIVSRHLGVKRDGNVRGPVAPELQGRNVLQVAQTVDETARAFNTTPEEVRQVLESSRARLFEVRAARPRPHLDDKALTAWNGLMISAFARGAQALGDPAYLEAAQKAVVFIRNRLTRGQDQLWRRYRAGEAAVEGSTADYAFLIQGLIDLYEAGFDTGLLAWALALQERQDSLFWDPAAGGYFDATADPRVLLRLKEAYDGAEPSPNSVSALNLLRLHPVAPDKGLDKRAEALFEAFGQTLHEAPDSAPQMLSALGVRASGGRQVVIAGRKDASDTRALLNALRKEFLPDACVFLADGAAGQDWLGERAPELKAMAMVDGKAAAYVCRHFTCRKPVTDPRELTDLLKAKD